jgi:UDP-glucuronate 4-epimerase
MKENFLVTGAAGFIGFHLCRRLLQEGAQVTGIDNLNAYYEVSLKEDRLKLLKNFDRFTFHKIGLENRGLVEHLFRDSQYDIVVHLAAQAGVRYSLENPHTYVQSNIVGFLHVLEGCRYAGIKHLVFASSSSVYGANKHMPLSIHDNVDHPISLYATTKKADELMAHTYAALYGIPCTGLRFFTVYGPWGRPDMALFKFTRKILNGEKIEVYNYGNMKRDFTYIDDIIEGTVRVMYKMPEKITLLERELGHKAEKVLLPLQPGDVVETWADVDDLVMDVGFAPKTTLEEGIKRFVEWYKEYYDV